jgi:hypothetical protein
MNTNVLIHWLRASTSREEIQTYHVSLLDNANLSVVPVITEDGSDRFVCVMEQHADTAEKELGQMSLVVRIARASSPSAGLALDDRYEPIAWL